MSPIWLEILLGFCVPIAWGVRELLLLRRDRLRAEREAALRAEREAALRAEREAALRAERGPALRAVDQVDQGVRLVQGDPAQAPIQANAQANTQADTQADTQAGAPTRGR